MTYILSYIVVIICLWNDPSPPIAKATAALLIVIWTAMLPGTIGPPPPRYIDLNEVDKQNEIYKSLMMKGY